MERENLGNGMRIIFFSTLNVIHRWSNMLAARLMEILVLRFDLFFDILIPSISLFSPIYIRLRIR